MTKNFQEKLHQEEFKQWNVQIFVPVERTWVWKILQDFRQTIYKKKHAKNICKIKQMQNIPVNLRALLNPLKTF